MNCDFLSQNVIPLEALQLIVDAFALANGVASVIETPEGLIIGRPANLCSFCNLIRSTAKGREKCLAGMSGTEGEGRLGKRVCQPCQSFGFREARIPLFFEKKHCATWWIGQCCAGEVDENRVLAFALEVDVDSRHLLDVFRKMPKISQQRFEQVVQFAQLVGEKIFCVGHTGRAVNSGKEQIVMSSGGPLSSHQEFPFLLAAMENFDDAVVITDATPKIVYMNPAVERITGYSFEDLYGKNPKILKSDIHTDDFFSSFWQELMRNGTWSGRFMNRKKDGTLYQEYNTISVVKNDDGKVIYYVAVKRDITREVELERQLHYANKMDAIGTLAAGIAHEMNTPIQFVANNMTFLKDSFADLFSLMGRYEKLCTTLHETGQFFPDLVAVETAREEIEYDYLREESSRALDGALEGLARISIIVKAMKSFSQQGERNKIFSDLNEIVENTVAVLQNEWRCCATIDLHLAENLPKVMLFADEFKQVVLGLLLNAIHAIKEKQGQRAETIIEKIVITTSRKRDKVQMTVCDTGCGIPEDLLPKIFDPFFTTKGVGKGTGQGLSIAYNIIVKGHGGEITVESVFGEKTVFTIILPVEGL